DIAALITKMDQAAVEGAAFIADGRPWNDAGASDLDELAIVLASAAGMLRLLAAQGIGGEQAARRLGIALSADAEQFPTIAKFRAVRLLFGRLFEVAGFGIPLPKVHGETAWRMMAHREPTMNMIRATTAAFAAATGGADSITVLSPLLDGEAFSNRMARNTQLILQEESSLYRAADPGAGSGAIEALTNGLAAAAWDRFTGIEAKGGLIAVVQSGAIQRAVAATREARLEQVSRRQIPLVGVNVNVDRAAVALDPDRIARESLGDEVEPLRATRLSERFEALCRRSLGKDGGRQRVVLVNLAHATGDALAVVADAFAAGGFAVEVADGRDAERAVAPDAPIACILTEAGSAEAANRVGQALRAAGARFVIAAGHHPEEPPSPPFDAVLSRDSDLIALFSEALDRIAAAQKNGQS
ncbi:MAG TPA: methylmalonyl-CoA mutase family protein, partial [Bauldia sp.]|nr:methylmalonyl-CoA mutase family protein [Bauldia sp.]